ncbi:hypothetical protein DPMN_127036 [Dreissena polymorpha]|uniref:Uncharacterized protein n=1 Tax=Dreissena polymorpha TaxID=45954 RepID=A0A9D4H0H6_DREPO|nr:hypothetical protein DPMN_127036 [Dreissena polymorpha]
MGTQRRVSVYQILHNGHSKTSFSVPDTSQWALKDEFQCTRYFTMGTKRRISVNQVLHIGN